jgi:hypothetical protein
VVVKNRFELTVKRIKEKILRNLSDNLVNTDSKPVLAVRFFLS